MSKLERWLPFKFRRKNHDEKNQEPQASAGSQLAGSPLSQQWMQGFFDDAFLRDPFGQLDQMTRWFGDFSPRRFAPSMEVSDDGKALKVAVELPGMNKDDVSLQIDGNSLVVSGEKKTEGDSDDEGVYRTERYYGYFQRAIPLPEDVDRERAEAKFDKGVLTVRLPRVEGQKPAGRSIAIQG